MIEVQHLTKRYGRVTAVDDVSFRVERGEILGFLGPERRRQDDDDADPDRLHAGHRGQSDRRRLRRLRPADRGQAPDRLPAGNAAALPRHDRRSSTSTSSPRSKACPAERRAARPGGDGAHAHRRHGEPAVRQAVERLPAARRPGAGAHPQSRRADPRRADRRPRPEADHRNAPADQGARRRSHDHPQHAHPAGSLADLPARRHHQQGHASSRSTRPTT